MRRHRHQPALLRRIAVAVASSSALALALLGLAAAPASAKTPVFVQQTGAANPFASINASATVGVTLGDLDGDGDLDLVRGNASGAIAVLRNTGTPTAPAFSAWTPNPISAFGGTGKQSPALVDLDGDGDLDLVVGAGLSGFSYLENTGSRTSPQFTSRTGSGINPLFGVSVLTNAAPAVFDLDRDGDRDLITGDLGSSLYGLRNTGSAATAVFTIFGGTSIPSLTALKPASADFDRDGDVDLILGHSGGGFAYLENIGGEEASSFASLSNAANPLAGVAFGSATAPAAGDLDGDGDADLVTASEVGASLSYFENQSGSLPARTATGPFANPLGGLDLGDESTPVLADFDGDGDLDVLVGEYLTGLHYFANTGSRNNPAYVERTGLSNPFDGLSSADRTSPAVGDLERDGDLDLVIGSRDGNVVFLRNVGNATTPFFSLPLAVPLFDAGTDARPALGDLDDDGDLDLLVGELAGRFAYYENTGLGGNPAFVARTGSANPFDGRDVGVDSSPQLGDLDGDGDLDLISGRDTGSFVTFENRGSAASPLFDSRTGARNPLQAAATLGRSAPAFGDLDGDRDADLVAGSVDGTLAFFENAIVEPTPDSMLLVGATDPLAGFDVGSDAASAAGDLDADGDPDVVAGRSDGTFAYLENAGSAIAPALLERFANANPFDGLTAVLESAPALVDLEGDRDLDLVSGNIGGLFFYFENTGNVEAPAFVARTGATNPFDGLDAGDFSKPAFLDLNADGDPDLVAGNAVGTLAYFENTGAINAPAFVARTGAANPLGAFDVGAFAAAGPSDVDRDGDLDLLVGRDAGDFVYLENTGSRTAPAFIERTGLANPMNGRDVGDRSTPHLAPLERPRHLDLVGGNALGGFATYRLPEPGLAGMLAAGLTGIAWLGRAVRRRRGA